MGRLFRLLAVLLGSAVLGLLLFAGVVIGLRALQVAFFYEPLPAEHAEQKAAYLASLAPVDPATAPNVVVIFFDDLGYGDLSSYGSQLIRTPRIDQAAREGMRFTSFYSGSPVCTPSRAALLTGRYPVRSRTHRHVFFSEDSWIAWARKMLGVGNEIPRDEIMIPEILGAAGYATAMVGKWHLGGIPGHLPNDFGFDAYYGVLWSNDMQPLHVYRNAEIELRDETPIVNGGAFRDAETDVEMRGVDQRTLTRRYTEESIAFIEAHRDEPFFLYLAHTFPHVPHFADLAHAGESPGGVYGDVVEDLDRSTGAILDALDRLGLSDETLVLITSDNGADYNGSPGFLRGRKGDTYEGGQRVPLVARWPGRIPAGAVNDAMAMNIDFLPTALALAGLPAPEDRVLDGRDLTAVLEGAQASPHEALHYFSVPGGAIAASRGPRFKYIAESGDLGRSKPQLHDLARDQENHNLIALHPEPAARLRRAFETMRDALAENPRGWR